MTVSKSTYTATIYSIAIASSDDKFLDKQKPDTRSRKKSKFQKPYKVKMTFTKMLKDSLLLIVTLIRTSNNLRFCGEAYTSLKNTKAFNGPVVALSRKISARKKKSVIGMNCTVKKTIPLSARL